MRTQQQHCFFARTMNRKQAPEEVYQPQLIEPLSADIILGRGQLRTSRPGNKRFHSIIEACVPGYDRAKTKRQKTQAIQEIYYVVKGECRFLKIDHDLGGYVDVDEITAKEKVGHAIRYKKRGGNGANKPPAPTALPAITTHHLSREEEQTNKKLIDHFKRSPCTGDYVPSVRTTGNPEGRATWRRSLSRQEEQLKLKPSYPIANWVQSKASSTRSSVISLTTTTEDDIISDEELLSVVGRPEEISWPSFGSIQDEAWDFISNVDTFIS